MNSHEKYYRLDDIGIVGNQKGPSPRDIARTAEIIKKQKAKNKVPVALKQTKGRTTMAKRSNIRGFEK